MNKIHIGDSGWRAVYSDGFTVLNLDAIVWALSHFFPKQKVLIGFDNRFLSKELAHHTALLLTKRDWKVDLLEKMFPTPGVGKLVKELSYDWGLIITASHNPYYYNGLKILDRNGSLSDRNLNDRLQEEAFRIQEEISFPSFNPTQTYSRSLLTSSGSQEIYLKGLLDHVREKIIQKASLKVCWDSFGGTTTPLLAELLDHLQVTHYPVSTMEEPTYHHRRLEPDAASLVELGEMVRQTQSTVGLATDVDGDRFSAVDEKGNYIQNNPLGSLMVWYLLELRKERGTVYQTVSSSSLTERICKAYGVELETMPVGFQVMGHKMQENPRALVGIEETGGLAYKPHFTFKDGLMAHLLLLEMLATLKKNMSQLLEELYEKFGSFYYDRIDLKLENPAEKEKWLKPEKWEKILGEKIEKTLTLDGIKWFFPSGWLLIRSSKTEPLLRIYFESEKRKFVEKIRDNLAVC